MVRGQSGFLFEPGDTEELAARVRSLVDDPPAARAMAAFSRELLAGSAQRYRRGCGDGGGRLAELCGVNSVSSHLQLCELCGVNSVSSHLQL